MITLSAGDQITLANNEKYLFIMEIPLEDKKYSVLQKDSDDSLYIGEFNADDEFVVVKDKPTLERIQKYLAQLPEE